MSSLHPLDPEIVAETDVWFYEHHPRGQALRTPGGDIPLDPDDPADDQASVDWVAEYRRRLAEKKAGEEGNDPSEDLDEEPGGPDPLDPCLGCCLLDFSIEMTPVVGEVEIGDSSNLVARELRPPGLAPVGSAGTFTWTTTSDKLSIDGLPRPGSQVAEGQSVSIEGFDPPNTPPEIGELVEATWAAPGCAPVTRSINIFVKKCRYFELTAPKIVAMASNVPAPATAIVDPSLPGTPSLPLAQDAEHGTGRALPFGPGQGTTVAELAPAMRELLDWFAGNDTDGKARRLFDHFLAPQAARGFWSDADLTRRLDEHPNIQSWISLALNSPVSPETSGRHRIHQALQAAGWDINAMVAPTDLGTPAVNEGSQYLRTEDFANGLSVMINDFTHVVAVATAYHYDRCRAKYVIDVDFVFYDVFGLDDDDLREFGADGGLFDNSAAQGITAWWQLQHQHDHAPPITRAVIERKFTVPTR